VVFRIAVFYVGSVLLLTLLLPYTAYKAGVSPFVTFFGSLGVNGADAIMNFVVLTAALSSLNAGMYSTGRILRSLAVNGSAPAVAAKMNRNGVPYVGILLTAVVSLIGVGLNAVVPEAAFEIALNISALLLMCSWATIVACQLRLWQWSKQGRMQRPSFRMPWAPYSSIAVLIFLATCVVLTALDFPVGTYTVASLPIVGVLLVIGWFLVRRRVREIAEAREGYTGAVPVLPELARPRASSQD
jgi:L-asparagine permease